MSFACQSDSIANLTWPFDTALWNGKGQEGIGRLTTYTFFYLTSDRGFYGIRNYSYLSFSNVLVETTNCRDF